MVHFRSDPLAYGIAVLATCGAAHLGLRSSLERFPWRLPSWLQRIHQQVATGKIDAGKEQTLGWPFALIGPKFYDVTGVSFRHAFLTGLLAGWWFYVLVIFLQTVLFKDDKDVAHIPTHLYDLSVLLMVAGRVFAYIVVGYLPPISLRGRLATGRWIIPGYDQVFVAPLLAVLAGLILLWALPLVGVQLALAAAVALAVSLFLVLAVGPDLLTWRLTGHHRIVPLKLGQMVKVG
jgi:hypothetical protein